MNCGFCIVLFDDGFYYCTTITNVRKRNNNLCAKWKNSWFKAKLICVSSKEACQLVAYSMNNKIPYIGKL